MKPFNIEEKTKRLILSAFCGVGLVVTGLLAGLALAGRGVTQIEIPAEENTQLSVESPAETELQTAPPASNTDAAPMSSAEEPNEGAGEGREVYAATPITYVLVLENEGMLVIKERSAAFGLDRELMELPFEAAELDDMEREELSRGMEFETLSEIDEYLESAES